jgi:geranylgeranyl diphosphate synthase type I
MLNPIHMGMVLADADCEDTNAITEYALNMGKAFQITDDLLIMGNDKASGKNGLDDIREGKKTYLTVYAAQHADPDDAEFLKKSLGNQKLSAADFKRCRKILTDTGAVAFASQAAITYIEKARSELRAHADRWDEESVRFLDELASSLAARTV